MSPPSHSPASNKLGRATNLRPLSDIREITEPSLIDEFVRSHNAPMAGLLYSGSMSRKCSQMQHSTASHGDQYPKKRSGHSIANFEASTSAQVLEPDNQSEISSAYSLSLENVPPRSSSKHRLDTREHSIPCLPPSGSRPGVNTQVPSTPRRCTHRTSTVTSTVSDSAGSAWLDGRPVTAYPRRLESVPLRIRERPANTDILDFPVRKHPRIVIELQLVATVFIGGEDIDGSLRVVVAELERSKYKRIAIGWVSIDLIGSEETTGGRRAVFFSTTKELIDFQNPPPPRMAESSEHTSPTEPFWYLSPSVSYLPFALKLPRDVGPPPFSSKNAKIRYTIAATGLIRDQSTQHLVRSSQELSILSTQMPEKVLIPLRNPLTACDEFVKEKVPAENIRLTAMLYRQVWVSGTNVFVDVHVVNNSKKPVRRLELQLERSILYYKPTAVKIGRMVDQSRLFDHNERTILAKRTIKVSNLSDWMGVPPHESELRKFDLELPRGNATVRRGKFFEVRYFLNIMAGAMSKASLVAVQLPIVLIHMNSLGSGPTTTTHASNRLERKNNYPRRPSARSPQKIQANTEATSQDRAFVLAQNHSRDRISGEAVVLESSPVRCKVAPRHHQDESFRPVGVENPGKLLNIVHRKDSSRDTLDKLPTRRAATLKTPCSAPCPPPWCSTPNQFDSRSAQHRQPLLLPRTFHPEAGTSVPGHSNGGQGHLRTTRSADVMRNSLSANRSTYPVLAETNDGQGWKVNVQGQPFNVPVDTFSQQTPSDMSGLRRQFRRMRSLEKWKKPSQWFTDRSRGKSTVEDGRNKGSETWI